MAFLLALAAASIASAAPAQPPLVLSSMKTSRFVEACAGTLTDLTEDICVGYIMGVLDRMSISRQICLPYTGSTTLQAVAVTRKYLTDHPDRWNLAPISLVSTALRDTFPCRPRRSRMASSAGITSARTFAGSAFDRTKPGTSGLHALAPPSSRVSNFTETLNCSLLLIISRLPPPSRGASLRRPGKSSQRLDHQAVRWHALNFRDL